MVGVVVLGHLASWHDRGPGGRHDDGARSRGRGPTHPVTTGTASEIRTLLYNIGVVGFYTSHCDRSSPPSTERCWDDRRLHRDSYGLLFVLIRPQSADTSPPSPIVGLRCGFGLRLRAPSLFFSLACRRVPFSLRRFLLGFSYGPTLQKVRYQQLPRLPAFALLLCLATDTADSLSAGRRAGCRRRIGVPELPATGIAYAATP